MPKIEDESEHSADESGSSGAENEEKALTAKAADNAPAVRVLLLAFMFMFQGYGAMVGNPQHALKHHLHITHAQAAEFQEATATFQLAKLAMRLLQIAFLVFVSPNQIVYIAYAVMFIALMCPIVLVWGAGITGLWAVKLQYIMGGIAVGLFEGTFLSVISKLGKNTTTFAIMGAPLGFFVNNTILGLLDYFGMPALVYYYYNAACLPIAAWIFWRHAPKDVKPAAGSDKKPEKGCAVFMNSMKKCSDWLPIMIPYFIAKFIGNFVLEDGFPLLFNTFNSAEVPIFGGPDATDNLIPFKLYTALIWFPCMAFGDTISRRVPNFLDLSKKSTAAMYLVLAIVMCLGGEALTFLLIALVTALAAFIANFGNGFIYGLSSKFIAENIAEEHRYTAYNLWCFIGDVGGYFGQGAPSVALANKACGGRHFPYVCQE